MRWECLPCLSECRVDLTGATESPFFVLSCFPFLLRRSSFGVPLLAGPGMFSVPTVLPSQQKITHPFACRHTREVSRPLLKLVRIWVTEPTGFCRIVRTPILLFTARRIPGELYVFLVSVTEPAEWPNATSFSVIWQQF